MDKSGHHLIAIKFLTSIIMGLIFAFLLVFVFTPEKRDFYPAYEFEEEAVMSADSAEILAGDQIYSPERKSDYEEFNNELRQHSRSLMAAAKEASLDALTKSSIERVSGLRDNIMSELNQLKNSLQSEEEELLSQKRTELEAQLSAQLEEIRSEIKAKYSDYSQKEIRENYIEILNLRTAVEVVAETAAEREQYQQKLDQVLAEQNQLLAEKSRLEDMDIAERTQELIVDFNSEYSQYREQIRGRHDKIISEREDALLAELEAAREKIEAEMLKKREIREAEINSLIEQSLAKYY